MLDSIETKSRKKLKKKRYVSFKGKIRRGMFLNTFITVSLFTVTILVVLSIMITLFGQFIAYSKGGELAEFISSQRFLDYAEISNLKQMIRPKFNREFLKNVFEQRDAMVFMKPEEMAKTIDLEDVTDHQVPLPEGGFVLLQFQFRLGKNIVYTTPGFNQASDFIGLDTYTSTPFTSVTGEYGVVESRITPRFLEFAYLAIAILIIVIALIAMMLSMIVAHFFTAKIIRPIRSLIIKMNKIAEEELVDVVQHEIHVSKPVQEIVELTDASNAIFLKMRDFTLLLEAQNQELMAQNDELEASSEQLADLNDEINLFNVRLENILNNSGQGFLAFGENLKINAVYSKECEIIFEDSISGLQFSELIYKTPSESAFLDRIYQKIILSQDNAEIYIDLLPTEWVNGELYYQIEHRVISTEINERGIMVILTDITHKKQLEESMQREQSNLHRVVKIVRYPKEFKSLYEDMQDYQRNHIMNINTNEELSRNDFYEIYREFHNFKGLLSQFDFQNSVLGINEIEEKCSIILDEDEFSSQRALEMLLKIDLMGILDDDLVVVDEYLGKASYQQSNLIQIDELKLAVLEDQLKTTLNFETLAMIMPYLQQLKDRTLKSLFRSFPEYAEKLADRLEKSINPFRIDSEGIECDLSKYTPLAKSIIHLVRNAIDHGIESADERLEAGKCEKGTIGLRLYKEGSDIVIAFSDDGAGIDVEMIREQMVDGGSYNEQAIREMSDEEILKNIYKDQFTTKREATDISGRGVGLSAVLHEVEVLDGSIEVVTKVAEGTTFIIRLPLLEEDFSCSVHLEVFETEVMERTKSVFKGYTGKLFDVHLGASDIKHDLYRYTALMNIKGVINALIVLSMPEELIKALGKGYLRSDEVLSTEEYEDLVLEISNVIVGNSLEALGIMADQIKLGTPTLVCYNGASVKYSESDIRAFVLTCEDYSAHISLLYY